MPRLCFDEKWLREYEKRTGKSVQGERRPSSVGCADTFPSGKASGSSDGKRPKYGNVKVTNEDGTFDSKHEARVWEELKLRARSGEIVAVGRQVTFWLPGGVKYVADFVVFYPDGRTEVLDAKSEATRRDKVYRMKKKLMRECLGIEIKEV